MTHLHIWRSHNLHHTLEGPFSVSTTVWLTGYKVVVHVDHFRCKWQSHGVAYSVALCNTKGDPVVTTKHATIGTSVQCTWTKNIQTSPSRCYH